MKIRPVTKKMSYVEVQQQMPNKSKRKPPHRVTVGDKKTVVPRHKAGELFNTGNAVLTF